VGYLLRIFDQEKQNNRVSLEFRALSVAAALAILLAFAASCGGSGDASENNSEASQLQVAGAGSSAQEVAQEYWARENFLGPPEATVTYEPVGSFEGVRRFIAGEVALAGTDVPLEGRDLDAAADRCKPGQLVEIPVYVSGVVVAFNVGGTSSVELAPETLAKIFRGEITRWRDPVIRRENPSITVFRGRIVPVFRSGESGTTENLTEYLAEAAPGSWSDGTSASWPLSGGEAAASAEATIEAIFAREGTIGYVDASKASTLGKVALKVGRIYVRPTPESFAKGFGVAREDEALAKGPYTFPFELDRKTRAQGAYPIGLVSYLLACTKYDSAREAAAVKGFLRFATSREGQVGAAEEAGSAPLPASVAKRLRPAIEAIE
jgi:phosphate transport system substrate-binding protein